MRTNTFVMLTVHSYLKTKLSWIICTVLYGRCQCYKAKLNLQHDLEVWKD